MLVFNNSICITVAMCGVAPDEVQVAETHVPMSAESDHLPRPNQSLVAGSSPAELCQS
jgi:hypothetical protein